MNEFKNDYCDHNWDGGTPARLCLSCGEIRTFPGIFDNPEILWLGKNCKENPLELPRRSKQIIAQVAQRGKIRKAEKLTGIPMHILRAWVGAYCRAPSKKGERPARQQKGAKVIPMITPETAPAPANIDFAPLIVKLHGRYRIYQF